VKKDKSQLHLNSVLADKVADKDFNIEEVDPLTLLSANRFDLAAKLTYLRLKDKISPSGFGQEVYVEHLKVMNGLLEADSSQKLGAAEFIDSFDRVYESIDSNGYDSNYPLPLSTGAHILDGAHRLAAALFLKKKVKVVEVDLPTLNLNYEFFRDRGLSEVFLDEMALEYLKYKSNLFIVLVWPTAGKENVQSIEGILKGAGDIVYKKEIKLKRNGAVLLVKEAYSDESWVGDVSDGFQGAKNKAGWCFSKKGPLNAYLFESTTNLVELKEKIRGLIGEGKHAVHITDTIEETTMLSNLLFNKNAVHWLNNALIRDFKWFQELLSTYQQFLKGQILPEEEFCLDGSAVLAAYGIREPRDLDFVHTGVDVIESGFKEIGDHNQDLEWHPCTKSELLHDPRCYFYFSGFKMVSLEVIREQKKSRNEQKDIEDLSLIDKLVQLGEIKIPLTERLEKLKNLTFWKSRIKLILLKIRYHFTKMKLGRK
jgi:hypothetical protein